MERLLAAPGAADALRIARDTGVLTTVFPELADVVGFEQESRYHALTCDEHILHVLDAACRADAPLSVRWAALFHDAGKPASAHRGDDGHLHFYGHPDARDPRSHEHIGAELAVQALRRTRQAPEELIRRVSLLVSEHMYRDDAKVTPLRARKFVRRTGRDAVDELMLLRRCDRAGKTADGILAPEDEKHLTAWERMVEEAKGAPLLVKELAVNGHDAMQFGLEGRQIGETLEEILVQVVAEPEANERERLLVWLARRAVKAGAVGATEANRILEAAGAPLLT